MDKCAAAFLYAFGYYAFKLMLLLLCVATLGSATRPFSIVYEAGFLGASLCLFILCAIRTRVRRIDRFAGLLMVFWFLLGLRILLDGYLSPGVLKTAPEEYIVRSFGGVAIPMCVFAGGIRPRAGKAALWGFVIPLLIFCLLAVIFYRDCIGVSDTGLGYGSLEGESHLSSLTLSYAGAMMALIGIWLATRVAKTQRSILRSLWLWGMVVLGTLVMGLGEARGPVAAFLGGAGYIIVWGMEGGWRSRPARLITAACVLVVFAFMMVYTGHGLLDRSSLLLEEVRAGDRQAGSGRVDIWACALEQIWESPFIGSGLEVHKTGSHPHNYIVEAFMTTGILGGVAFVGLCVIGLRDAVRVFKSDPAMGWVALIFVHAFFGGMLSSSLISNRPFWFSLVAVRALAQVPGRAGRKSPQMAARGSMSLNEAWAHRKVV